MTIALWCVLAAALMPYLWVGVAHGVTCIVNQDTLRSVVWATGLACVIGLFVVSA